MDTLAKTYDKTKNCHVRFKDQGMKGFWWCAVRWWSWLDGIIFIVITKIYYTISSIFFILVQL